MRKKYLSALLFGALLFASAGTFTSCKDYDDDIDNLQQQIDGLATKEDMQAKLDQMQTAVNDAKATAEEALEKANAAGDADKIAELEGRIAELEKTLGDIDAMKEEIQNALDSQIADFREEMEELLEEVKELTGYSLGMVTSVDLQINENAKFDTRLDLNYSRIATIVVEDDKDSPYTSYEFGKGLTGAFTVNKGDVYTVKDNFLASIAPVDAVISPNMISLINSKEETLNDYVTYTSTDYNGLLTSKYESRSVANGLREIGVQLKSDVDFEAFHKLVSQAPEGNVEDDADEKNYVNYALAITDVEKDSRTVASTYDLIVNVTAEVKAIDIDKHSTISSDASLSKGTFNKYDEAADGTKPEDEGCYPAKLGESFTIDVKSAYDGKFTNGTYPKGGRVMASYVIVDYDNEALSPTDIAAIKSLKFTGVDQVSKDNKFTITIDGESSGIVLPLKVVTIDYTGNVENHVIWVKAGKEAIGLTAGYTVTPESYVTDPKAYTVDTECAKFTIPEDAYYYTLSMNVGESNHNDTKQFGVDNMTKLDLGTDNELKAYLGSSEVSFLKVWQNANATGKPAEAKKVAYAEFVAEVNLNSMKEDVTYTGQIKFYNDKGTYLSTNEIKVTKKLPTAVPSYFSAKTNAINNGVLTVYPNPTDPNATPIVGEFDLNKAFNGLTEASANRFVLSSSALTDDNLATLAYNKISSIDPNIINDGKTYAAEMSYNYGRIEYQPVGVGVATVEDYKVKWDTDFAIKFGCVPVDSKYAWTGAAPTVYYKEDIIINPVTKTDKDGKPTEWGNFLTVKDPYGQTLNPFSSSEPSTEWNWAIWSPWLNDPTVTINLITNGDRVNEFFTATIETKNGKQALVLKQTSTAVVLSGDVETTVVFKYTDKFGHPHEIPALTFTMKKDHAE